jgi:hypothetical protein
MPTDITATCYGLGGGRKYSDKTSNALGKSLHDDGVNKIVHRGMDPNKGEKCVRYQIASSAGGIRGGEIFLNGDITAAIANDTFTITVTADA